MEYKIKNIMMDMAGTEDTIEIFSTGNKFLAMEKFIKTVRDHLELFCDCYGKDIEEVIERPDGDDYDYTLGATRFVLHNYSMGYDERFTDIIEIINF